MITKPPIDSLTTKAGNRYMLCCAISKRAKQLNVLQANDELTASVKTISYAAEELINDKIEIIEE